MFTIILALLIGIGAAFFTGFAFWQRYDEGRKSILRDNEIRKARGMG